MKQLSRRGATLNDSDDQPGKLLSSRLGALKVPEIDDLAQLGPPPRSTPKDLINNKPLLLCVDDEPFILEGLSLNLRRHFEVHTAPDGPHALELLRERSQIRYSIILSDMRMPKMDGATFLNQARKISPDSVRILLTGHADLQDAIRAVNEGHIFSYLSKPFPAPKLLLRCQEALRQYHINRAQKDVLERTLWGTIEVLIQILNMVNPLAFGQTHRTLSTVRQLATHLNLKEAWQFEIAAMLSQIGCATISAETLAKKEGNGPLNEKEQEVFDRHPEIAAELIQKIPNLEPVAEMIRGQFSSPEETDFTSDLADTERVTLGAQLLRLAYDFGRLTLKGHSAAEAAAHLKTKPNTYHPTLLAALNAVESTRPQFLTKYITANELRAEMILDEDILTRPGVPVVSKGSPVTPELLDKLSRFKEGVGLREPFRVKIAF